MSSLISHAAMLGAFLACLLALFLILVGSRNRLANVLLALFLIATAIDISGWFMGGWWTQHSLASDLRLFSAVLQMPLFTGFVWVSCFQRSTLRPGDAIHLLPALTILGFALTDTPPPYLRILFELQYAIYISLAIYSLWRLGKLIEARFARRSPSWRWLAMLVASSLVAHGLFIVRTVFLSTAPENVSLLLQAIAAMLVLTITVWIALQALLNPHLFRGADQVLISASGEIGRDSDDTIERLEAYMNESRPYLDPNLTLSRLARSSGISARDLSELINQRHGVHFFDFVNRHRIEHAKTLLLETDQTVTEILYASGFNAKSSFNTAFRKHAGVTPTAYRKTYGI